MIVVLKPGATDEEVAHLVEKIEGMGLKTHVSKGEERTLVGAIGDESLLNSEQLKAVSYVDKVLPILKPYKLVSREFKSENSIIKIGDVEIGGKNIVVMAGPCAVESEEQLIETAKAVKASGATILRGGAFKPRTSPYSFQGMGEEGLKLLRKAGDETGMKIVTELMDTADVDIVAEYADIIQIGARNMQNFKLLKAVGKTNRPVLLKRGLAATMKELLMSAEYIMAEGNHNVILCERGIRTFCTFTRNTLDLNIVPALKAETHLPIIVDPSHGTGKPVMVNPMSRASIAAGADGLMIEVHYDPENASCDGDQSLNLNMFSTLMKDLQPFANASGRNMQ